MKKHFSRSPKYVLGLFVFIFAISSTFGMSYAQANRFDKYHPRIRVAIEAQNRHTDELKGIPGVVGTGTGIGPDGLPVIKVFTTRAGIPEIPRSLDGFPVEVNVTGMFFALADPKARFERPVPIGVSTGHPDITAGTIGCRVKDTDGNVYALSNNHVYANSNAATIGDHVIQPGTYDGGSLPGDYIGTLDDFVLIDFSGGNNTVDAAIALSSLGDLGNATPDDDGYGTPSSTTKTAYILQAVKKYGRTTGLTHGEVSAINANVNVCYDTSCNKLAKFVDQIMITPGTFSDGGDSGSLIVTDDGNNYPVGLLFAGSSTHTIANPINVVLDAFSVSIDGSSSGNTAPTADFTYTTDTTDNLTLKFTDASTDTDGNVVVWEWNFGDDDDNDNTSDQQNPTHIYADYGTYTVSLTVTDDGGATDTTLKNVRITPEGVTTISYLNDPNPDVSIPDCVYPCVSPTSHGIITSFIYVPDSYAVWEIASDVNITHTYRGDLGIKLTSPEGTEAPLKDPDKTDFRPYPDEPVRYNPTEFVNENCQGCWKLTVSDEMWDDVGTLNNWTLIIDGVPTDPVNQAPEVTITAPANGSSFTEGDSVTFDGSAYEPPEDIFAGIVWNSSIDGDFGTGASVTTTTLSAGNHIITARVEDSGRRTGCNSISVYLRPICNENGTCEAGENCNNCPSDCISRGDALCGNGICEPSGGEDCISCPADCAGKQRGVTSKQFCCGDGDGVGPVDCSDPRCTEGGFQCGDTTPYCCGDNFCEGTEDSSNCEVDCFCSNGTCDPGEDRCKDTGGYICAVDCGDPPPETSCSDGEENDCDGYIDCDDSDCSEDPACVLDCLPRGEVCSVDSECCSNWCHRGACK